MLDKISSAQFRFIYQEITRNNSKADTLRQAEYANAFAALSKTPILQYVEIYASPTEKTKLDSFWDIAKNVIEELTPVDDGRHTQGSTTFGEVAVNMCHFC